MKNLKLYDIQKHIIYEDKTKTGIFLGTGVGKTITALILAKGNILVICPKQQKLDETWEKNDKKFELGKDITSISKETFRRDWDILPKFDTIIFDECHNNLGVLPETRQRKGRQIPKTSQIFEASYLYLQKYPPKRLYFCSATPVTKPMHLWALAKLMGIDWDFFKFRETFYFPTMMGRRQVWMPKKDQATKQRLAFNVQKLGYTGALKDFMDVPEQTHIDVAIELTGPQKQALKTLMEDEADPLVRRSRMRTIENGVLYGKKIEEISDKEDRMVKDTKIYPSLKIDYIVEKAIEFPKLFIFANFTAQVHEIARVLREEGHKVFTVTGETKNRQTIFEEVDKMDEAIIVVQSMICEGYRVPSVPCMIFASKSNRYVHYEQGKGRILDGQHLKKNLYIHLVVKDGADEACHESIMSGQDFQEKLSVL